MSHNGNGKANMKFMSRITCILTPKVSVYVTQFLRRKEVRFSCHFKNGSQTNTLHLRNDYPLIYEYIPET